MIKMDGRDSVEYQIWEKRDIMVIIGFDFKSLKDKMANSSPSPSKAKAKTWEWIFSDAVASIFGELLERERESTSL